MIFMDLRDVLRDILGSYRVQFLQLGKDCSNPEAQTLDFQFRGQLFENFDYGQYARSIMSIVPKETVIDYKDDFGLHYLVFQGRDTESDSYLFFGPFLYHTKTEEDFEKMIQEHQLSENAFEAIHWYFKRIPIVQDVVSWRHMFGAFLSRYFADPDLEILPVQYDHIEKVKEKPSISLSAIPYTSIEARYETEAKMLEAVRRGDISEAMYQQNLFMGFTLDQRNTDPLRNAKNMVISVNTAFRKAAEQAAVHPLYLDAISGQFLIEIEKVENTAQAAAMVQRMIRHYCLLVQTYSRERYSNVVRDCLNFVDFHYMEPLSLDGLARKYAVNKNYLSSRFSKEVGLTLTDYINLTRVDRSLKLLSTSAMSMQEIAENCGFSDANYYTRIFKKIHGSTPNEYRKSLQKR